MSDGAGQQPPNDLSRIWDDERDVPSAESDVSRKVHDPRRVRVRKRVVPKRRRWPWVLAAVVVALGAGVALLGLDAYAVQGHLTRVRGDVVALQAALRSGDVEDAARLAEAAADEARLAQERSDGVLWTAAGVLPLVGDDVRTVSRLARLAVAATSLGEAAVRTAGPLLGGELDILTGPQQLDLDLFAELDRAVDALDVDALRTAAEDVRDVPGDHLVMEVGTARAEALDLADRALDGLDAADVALDVVPGFLGADGPRRYLIGLQTNAELRGTGGLMTYFSVLEARRGRLEVLPALRENELVDELSAPTATPPTQPAPSEPGEEPTPEPSVEPTDEATDAASEEPTVPPRFVADATDDFATRYDHLLSRSDYGNVNVDPDLTVVGPVLTQIAAATGGADYDGVIMLDPVGLQQLLAGGAPLPVPAELSQPPLPNPIPIDQLAQVLLIDNYNVLGGDNSAARQPYLKAVADAAITRVFADAGDTSRLLDAFGTAIATRHLQVHPTNQIELALFDALGASGRMARPQDGTDVLAVTGNNAAADKKDVHVAHRITGTMTLTDLRFPGEVADLTDGELAAVAGGADVLGTRTGLLEVAMVNPLRPGQYDDYIIGSAEVEYLGSPRTIADRNPNGPARTWFTIWNPVGFGARQVTSDGERVLFGSGVIHDLNATDYFLEVPLQDTGAFTADLVGPVGLLRDGDELVYTLTLWRQAKAIPDEWDLTVTAPPDLVVNDASLSGGGAGRTGFGPDAPDPLALSTTSRSVRIVGGATEDAVLEIRFGQP